MCGRFNQTASGEEIAEAFDLDEAPELAPRYNIAPTQPVAVVGVQPKTGRRGLALLKWGLVPRESLGGERGFINARAETAWEKPSFSEAFAEPPLPRSRRPASTSGRRSTPKRRQPWLIRLASGARLRVRRPLGAGGRAAGRRADVHDPHHRAQRRSRGPSTTGCR